MLQTARNRHERRDHKHPGSRRRQRLRDLLNRYLAEQGFGVHAVANATAMERVMNKESVDMIILDLMLRAKTA